MVETNPKHEFQIFKTRCLRHSNFFFLSLREKSSPSIIRASCRFDSKIRVFSGVPDFVSAYVERNKNFFQKIEISQNRPSFFAEK